jgi:metal-sulfur cluster biosynthetic enzyme
MQPDTDTVWRWLAEVPDPEIPVISITELGIVRDVDWQDDTLVVTVTPTYSGCPATSVINLEIEKKLRDKGVERSNSSASSRRPGRPTGSRGGQGEAARLRHRAAHRRHRRRGRGRRPRPQADRREPDRPLPALRLARHAARQPVRLDPLQGGLSVQRLPGTLRLFQMHLRRAWPDFCPSTSST